MGGGVGVCDLLVHVVTGLKLPAFVLLTVHGFAFAQPPQPPQPLDRLTAQVAPSITPRVVSAIAAAEAAAAPLLPARVDAPLTACRVEAARLIVRWEVTSPAHYTRALRFPIWPRGASGVTWGVGTDGGHQTRAAILNEWREHNYVERLADTSGIIGEAARQALPRFRDIPTEYPYAYFVFRQRVLVEYERRAARAFRNGFDQLRPGACAAMVSLVFNRGAAMSGDSRREMRDLRDKCVPTQDYACMARAVRSMKRLWVGTANERGLSARREDEARLIERN